MQQYITPAAAVMAAHLSDRIPYVGRLAGGAQAAAGVAIAYGSKFVPAGPIRAAVLGAGIGIAVEGVLDLALGQA